jgi:16S rRNA (adenine1518-N6/adenine1519-N6)-dimethyltransferase
MIAKKSFGQHFLINETIAENIAHSLLKASTTGNVLEIGPGKGMLTKYLTKQDIQLKVVEADADMVEYLKRNKIVHEDQIIFLDFLKLNLSKIYQEDPFCLIGNFPYNISSQIIFKMIQYKEYVPEMVGMFQKEVADRIVAPPGSKTYGVISVLAQAYYEGATIIEVPPINFSPPPKVQSSVIRLIRKENYSLGCDEKLFRTIVKTSFNSRRKMLRNTLKPLVSDVSLLEDSFFTKRPEQLSVNDFVGITNSISSQQRQVS